MKLPDPRKYKTLIFDCDGVILDSNKVKTEAFFETALPYGEKEAHELLEYHRNHGGISRYAKFEYFLNNIQKGKQKIDILKIIDNYSQKSYDGLLTCRIASKIEPLRNINKNACWMVVSGGDEIELKKIFNFRGIANFFDGGIHGSPESKIKIVEREINKGTINGPTLFIGDSRYDFEVSEKYKFDFLFLSEWTEFSDWRKYKKIKKFKEIDNIEKWLESINR